MSEEEYDRPKLKHTDFNKALEELYFHQSTIPGINIYNRRKFVE